MLKYLLVAIIITLLLVVKIFKNKISKNIFSILKISLIVLLLETTLFNINSYRLDFLKSKPIGFFEKALSSRTSLTTGNTQYIYLDDLNCKVKSIYIELEGLEEDEVVNYDIFYSDASTLDRYLATKTYCQTVEKTKYTVVSLSRRL